MRLAILMIIMAVCAPHAQADIRGLPQITVLAASSLTEPMTEIVRMYSRNEKITVTASYDATFEQARKIEEGESADIFVSSNPYWMTDLKQKGLIDVYSLTNLIQNKLVLVASTKGHINKLEVPTDDLATALNFLKDRTVMVLSDPDDTALGLYTKQTIENLDKKNNGKLWESLKNKTLKSVGAKNTLYLISHGETAGFTYYSDAYKNENVRIISRIDTELHTPIIYQAAVVAGENMSYARGFLEFLQSNIAKQIFKNHGFIVD